MKKNEARNIKISLVINVLIFVFTIFAATIMFTGFKFMYGYEVVLESTKIGMLRFFTVDSNIFMGVVALVFAFYEIQLLRGNIEELPFKTYILKLMATSAVGLTFFVVFAYLGPISKNGIPSMLMNSNLFFHLIIPVLSILDFILFEKTNKLKFKHSFLGIVPTALYELYYTTNVLLHAKDGIVSPDYDWYWFVQNGIWTALIVAPMILGVTYIISVILWKLNFKKIPT